MLGILSLGAKVLGWIAGPAAKLLAGQRDVEVERERSTGAIGSGLARTMEAEAAGRAQVQVAHASAGWWWLALMSALPPFILGTSLAVHISAVALDSTFAPIGSWGVARLPAPMDEWEGAIALTMMGVSGGLTGLAMVLRR